MQCLCGLQAISFIHPFIVIVDCQNNYFDNVMIVTNGFITIVGFYTHHVGYWFSNHCLFLQH